MKAYLLTAFFLLITLNLAFGQTLFEAEDGTITDANFSNEVSGYSGTGYIVFEAAGNILISVERETAGLYNLTIGYRSPYGEKTQNLTINESFIQSIVFPESTTFTTFEVGEVNLNAGANTIEIESNWGYMDFDYFLVDTETSPNPIADAGSQQVQMDVDGDGMATFTLNASATTDPNDDIVSYTWREGSQVVGTGVEIEYEATMGSHTLLLLVQDAEGNTDTDQIDLFVGDPTNDGNSLVSIRDGERSIFANGINLAWDDFARDIVQLDAPYFEGVLNSIEAAGGNTMRWWLHTNGRNSPNFDSAGNVTGISASTIPNMKTVLDMAYERGITISMCLWSFDMLQPQGQNQEMMKSFVESSAKIQTYIDNALIPILEEVGDHPAVLSWEIFNEAEGMTQEFGWTPVRTQMQYVQQFVNLTAGAIHRTIPSAQVSTGVWSFRALTDIEGNTNYYSDARLIAAGGDTDGTLDFYQVHYYPDNFPVRLSPFHRPADWWGLDKPIVIGEFPSRAIDGGTTDPEYTITEAYQLAYEYGYAGAMAWDYRGYDGGSFQTAKAGISYLAETYPEFISLGVETFEVGDGNKISLFPNPINENRLILKVYDQSPVTVELFDLLGRKLNDFSFKGQNEYVIETIGIPSGLILVRVSAEAWSTTQKVLKK